VRGNKSEEFGVAKNAAVKKSFFGDIDKKNESAFSVGPITIPARLVISAAHESPWGPTTALGVFLCQLDSIQ
jgi:hypothetical protein